MERVALAIDDEVIHQRAIGRERLGPDTHDRAVALAALPDEIRGYEHIKQDSIRRYRERAQSLLSAIQS